VWCLEDQHIINELAINIIDLVLTCENSMLVQWLEAVCMHQTCRLTDGLCDAATFTLEPWNSSRTKKRRKKIKRMPRRLPIGHYNI